jgi:hypothetical protein
MAYWARLPYKHKAIMAREYATTPSEWPHEFDATATMQGDHAAADTFEARWRQERESSAFHAGGVVKATSKALERWRYQREYMSKPVPKEHLDPTVEPAIDVGDFPDANASPAELREWESRHKAGEAA